MTRWPCHPRILLLSFTFLNLHFSPAVCVVKSTSLYNCIGLFFPLIYQNILKNKQGYLKNNDDSRFKSFFFGYNKLSKISLRSQRIDIFEVHTLVPQRIVWKYTLSVSESLSVRKDAIPPQLI